MLYMIEHDSATPIVEAGMQFQTSGTIGVQHQRWRYGPIPLHIHATNEMLKGGQECLVVGKKLWMLKLNRFHDRHTWMVVPEIVIEFVRFVDKVVALSQTIVCAETGNNGPDFASWIKTRIDQHQRQHGCRR